MNELIIALLTIFGTVASVTGVVLYVFNGTRSLIKEIHQTNKEILQTQKEMIELQKKVIILIEKIPERVVEKLKVG